MRERIATLTLAGFALSLSASAQGTSDFDGVDNAPNLNPPGLGPALTPRLTQDDILGMDELTIRTNGQRIFATPFNFFDGFGDGPYDPNEDPTKFGGRPTIGGNGTWLRVNGLDSQSCVECHFVLNNRGIPTTFAVGGVAGIGGSAMPGLTEFDLADEDGTGAAEVNGRKINPPFIWGSGGVELVAKEMTAELQVLKGDAMANPGTPVSLDTKGINFGSITYDDVSGTFDTSAVEGIDDDLVVKPFGRKGNNDTIRVFDLGAMEFHHGMQPEELVGTGVDADGDGVVNEITAGEISALHIYAVASEKPRVRRSGVNQQQVQNGQNAFRNAGCTECHPAFIDTDSTMLPIAFPEVNTDPWANVFHEVDLTASSRFQPTGNGGVRVPMFSDLKRHEMGNLAETTGDPLDPFFITPRLWGVADTAPYLHDGRALTISEAILLHDGEGAAAAAAFAALSEGDQIDMLAFLDTLRAPLAPNADLVQPEAE